ncbi:unnamed protein product, partial [marine sediment metagenome]
NGANAMMKYGGSIAAPTVNKVRTDGITVPPDPPTFHTPNIDGDLTISGTYYFKYTFVDENGYESNGGTASAAMTAGDATHNGITVNIAICSDDPKIKKRRIYRTTAGGSIYYKDGEVDNTVPTYDSIISDEEISLKSVLHTDHNAPPGAPSLVVKRLSRVNIAVDDDLYVSKNYDKTTGVRSVKGRRVWGNSYTIRSNLVNSWCCNTTTIFHHGICTISDITVIGKIAEIGISVNS